MLWQGIRFLYLPVVYALMRQALRGMPDAPTVAKLLFGVGLFRAGEAILFRSWYPSVDVLGLATTHADTVLFVTCLAILGALLLEMPSKRTFRLALVLSPLFLWAIRANNRRLAYAELALVVVVFWMLTPWRPLKRRVARVLVSLSLPILLYVGVGWGSEAGAFGPVRKFRIDARLQGRQLHAVARTGELRPGLHLQGAPGARPRIRPALRAEDRAARRHRQLRARAVHPAQQRGGTLGLRGPPAASRCSGQCSRWGSSSPSGPTAGPGPRWNG